jgi:hypothetical protein
MDGRPHNFIQAARDNKTGEMALKIKLSCKLCNKVLTPQKGGKLKKKN